MKAREGSIVRKALRLVGLLFPALYAFTSQAVTALVAGSILAVLVGLEIARLCKPAVNAFLFEHGAVILRDGERRRITTITWFVLAALLLALFFERGVAIAAWAYAIFGDLAAGIVGTRWGRVRLWGKSLEGSLAGLLVCLVLALGAWFWLHLPLAIVVTGAVMATAAELAPAPLDDNLTMPLAAGATMALAQSLL